MTPGRLRRSFAAAMALAGAALLIAAPVSAQDEIRTTTELLGYDAEASAAPITVRLFDELIPIPTDPGDPQLELTASFTQARVGTGPTGRAVASSIWPGPAVGDGFGTLLEDESQTYPVRASARYPGAGEDDWSEETTIPQVEGFGMHAAAHGLDVTARSEGGGLPGPVEALAAFGQIRSESSTTVEDTQSVARSSSQMQKIELLAGVIVLDTVRTDLEAVSDGEAATTSGGTTVGGIEILGIPVRLGDDGLVVDTGESEADEEDAGPLGPLAGLTDPVRVIVERLTSDLVADGIEETLGIHIDVFDHVETVDGAVAERVAGGLRVTVDVELLRGYLQPILDLVPIGDLLGLIPDNENTGELKGLLFEVLGLGPTVEFVVGRGTVAAAGTPPFEPPTLAPPPAPPPPPDPPPPPPPPSTGGTAAPPSTGDVSLPPPTARSTPPPTTVAPPETAPPDPVLAGEPLEPPAPFGGIPAGLVGFGLMVGAVPAWGLRSLREAAVGTGASSAPQALPDLRTGG